MNSKECWDMQAERYQNSVYTNSSDYTTRLFSYLRSTGALYPGCTVADIGCGAGKNAIHFAENGSPLLLVDISDKMMEYALGNLKDYHIPIESAVCDWTKTDTNSMGWNASVELAFGAMTPALESIDDLRKFSSISKKFCFISMFSDYEDAIAESFVSGSRKFPDAHLKCSEKVSQILQLGYYPDLHFVDYDWENLLTLDEAVSIYQDSTRDDPHSLIHKLEPFTDSDGMVHQYVHTKVAWLLWDISDKK